MTTDAAMTDTHEVIEALQGHTFTAVLRLRDDDELVFVQPGRHVVMRHTKDCCEHVRIDIGDIDDLAGVPIVSAVVSTHKDQSASRTWTFYQMRTSKGDVTVRWLGESNGYYSE